MAEGGGLLNRYRGNTPIVGSNPIPSANPRYNIQLHDGDLVATRPSHEVLSDAGLHPSMAPKFS